MPPLPISVQLASPATPATFQLQGTGELDIKSVTVTMDGSAAGTNFFPTLSIYTQDDRLLSRTQPASAVTAGQSAIVTWAPFLRKAAAAAAGSTVLPYAVVYDGFVSKAYPYPALDQVPFGSSAIHNDTNSIFSIVGGANLKQVQTAATGLYLVHTQVAWESWPITTPVQIRLLGMPSYQGENNYNRDLELVTANDQGVMEWTTTIAVNSTPFLFNLHAGQSSGVNQFLDGNFCKVVKLTDI